MRSPTLALRHPEATRARLVAIAKEIPGARIGLKIAALLLVLEGIAVPGSEDCGTGFRGDGLQLWPRSAELRPEPGSRFSSLWAVGRP